MHIHENKHDHLPDFIRLNEQWIGTYFQLEAVDHALAANPAKIIDEGGYIFTLTINDQVVATCALFNDGEHTYELARMAVDPNHHRQGHGQRLLTTALEKLHAINATKVYLVSNTNLEAAIALYKKHQFQTTHLGPHPTYNRANIIMERILS